MFSNVVQKLCKIGAKGNAKKCANFARDKLSSKLRSTNVFLRQNEYIFPLRFSVKRRVNLVRSGSNKSPIVRTTASICVAFDVRLGFYFRCKSVCEICLPLCEQF